MTCQTPPPHFSAQWRLTVEAGKLLEGRGIRVEFNKSPHLPPVNSPFSASRSLPAAAAVGG